MASSLKPRIRIFAKAHMVFGGIGLLLGALLCMVVLADRDPAHRQLIYIFAPVYGGLALAYFMPSFVGGLGLLRGIPWARVLFWAQAALMAPLVPFGTVLAAVSLLVLVPRADEVEDTKARYFAFERALARSIRPGLIALAALATLGAMIGLGYIFRDQIEALDPPPSQELTPLPDFKDLDSKRPEYKPREFKRPDPRESDGSGR